MTRPKRKARAGAKPHPDVTRAFDAFCKAIAKHPKRPAAPSVACIAVLAPDGDYDSYAELQRLNDFCVEFADERTVMIHAIAL